MIRKGAAQWKTPSCASTLTAVHLVYLQHCTRYHASRSRQMFPSLRLALVTGQYYSIDILTNLSLPHRVLLPPSKNHALYTKSRPNLSPWLHDIQSHFYLTSFQREHDKCSSRLHPPLTDYNYFVNVFLSAPTQSIIYVFGARRRNRCWPKMCLYLVSIGRNAGPL